MGFKHWEDICRDIYYDDEDHWRDVDEWGNKHRKAMIKVWDYKETELVKEREKLEIAVLALQDLKYYGDEIQTKKIRDCFKNMEQK